MNSTVRSYTRAVRRSVGTPSRLRAVVARSSVQDSGNKELVTKAEALVTSDPDAMAAIERIRAAAEKVESLRARRVELDAAMAADQLQREVSVRNAERSASEQVAKAEVAAAEMLMQAAEMQANLVAQEKQSLLNSLAQDAERVESGKAATAAVVGGLFAAAPLALTSGDDPLVALFGLGAGLATCALFGVVYRYVVRSDARTSHLVGGAVAAFGLARGLGLAEATLRQSASLEFEVLAQAALAMGQSMLVVGFAAAATEAAMQRGLVAEFGKARSRTE